MLDGLARTNRPAVGLADQEMNHAEAAAVPLLPEHAVALRDDLVELARERELFEAHELNVWRRQRAVIRRQEEFERLARPARDLLQRLHRRLHAVVLDQVDGGAADMLAGHVGEGQAGLQPRLPDRADADPDPLAAPAIFAAGHGGEHTATPASALNVCFTASARSSRPGPGRTPRAAWRDSTPPRGSASASLSHLQPKFDGASVR